MGSPSFTPHQKQLKALISDMRSLLDKHSSVSRDFYRVKGAFPEKVWSKYFPTFKDFIAAVSGDKKTKTSSPEEVYEIQDDTYNISIKNTRIHTLPELLEYCKVDLSVWEVERFIVNKWEMASKSVDGGVDVTPLYQVKATLAKRKEIVDAKAEIDKIKAEFKKSAPVVRRYTPATESDNLLEINIPDSHFGKMAWGKETGDKNYDTPIAAAIFLRAVDSLVKRASGYNYSRVVFVVGNDLLNSDDELGRTTKGTFVSTDCRYQKTFSVVRKTITEAIETLRKVAPVEVIMVSGNHDNLGVWHLGDSLECIFENYADVHVNNDPTSRKYIRHGKVLLMFTHGDKGKRDDYPLLMATERSKDFGETLFREIHTGHIHQTKLQEFHGVRVRILPSLSPPDAWHSENGFIGQQRNAEAYVWNNQEGLIAQFYHNDDAYPDINTHRILMEGECKILKN
jgi:predicted phosphodiesterase